MNKAETLKAAKKFLAAVTLGLSLTFGPYVTPDADACGGLLSFLCKSSSTSSSSISQPTNITNDARAYYEAKGKVFQSQAGDVQVGTFNVNIPIKSAPTARVQNNRADLVVAQNVSVSATFGHTAGSSIDQRTVFEKSLFFPETSTNNGGNPTATSTPTTNTPVNIALPAPTPAPVPTSSPAK